MKGLGESFFANTNITAQDCAIQEIAEIVALGGSWKCVGNVGVLESPPPKNVERDIYEYVDPKNTSDQRSESLSLNLE